MLELNGFSEEIWRYRYALPEEKMWYDTARRVASAVSRAENDDKIKHWEDKFYNIISNGYFMPGGRILRNAGRKRQSMINCFHKDTFIFTKEGWKKIIDVKIGDLVLTHRGRFMPVVNKFSQGRRDKLFKIKVRGLNGKNILRVTADHKILTPNGYIEAARLKTGDYIITGFIQPEAFEAPDFLRISDHVGVDKYRVIGDKIGTSCKSRGQLRYTHGEQYIIPDFKGNPCNNIIPFNEDFAIWAGYYLAEGTAIHQGTSVLITFHKKELDFIQEVALLGEKLFGIKPHIEPSNAGEWTQVKFHSTVMCDFHKVYFGAGFNNKRIPYDFYGANRPLKIAILTGLIRGDGSKQKMLTRLTKSYTLTCANTSMIYDAYLLAD